MPTRRALMLAALPLPLAGQPVHGMPPAYGAQVVVPRAEQGQQVFDLRAAQAQARRRGLRLYVYLNADDCGYCRRYEAFLAANVAALRPAFERDWLIVDLRSSLRHPAADVVLQTERLRLPYLAFQRAIGDERTRALVYPNVWVMDADARPLMQMPAGTGTFETVDEQLEILTLTP